MTIGERIKQRRKELDISVDSLASTLNKNRATVYRYESDDIENLPISVLEPLATALYTTPAFLMGWEDGANNESQEFNGARTLFQENFKQILKAFGYEILSHNEETVTVLKEGSEKIDIKPDAYENFMNSVRSYMEFGLSKLMESKN